MRSEWRMVSAVLAMAGLASVIEAAPARAQMAGMRRPLGGYGAATIGSYYGNRGGPLIPYNGGQGGFIPYEGLEGRRPAAAAMMPRQIPTTPIGGMGLMGIPIGGTSRMRGPDIYRPFNYQGRFGGRFGMGGPSRTPRRYGPGLGYPFRQPPSLR